MKGNSITRPNRRPAYLLALGFTLSAVGMFGAVSALGAGLLGPARSSPYVWLAATVVLAVLLAADLRLFGMRTPTWRRQTPKWFIYRFSEARTAFLWGVDAGLVFTTFRITSMSWAALSLTLLGVLPWWTGACYALGFVVPELVFGILLPRRPTDETGLVDPEPVWVADLLLRARPGMRPAGLVAMAATGVFAAASFVLTV